MPDTSTLLLFSGTALLLLIIPGPAVLYIVARSASQGTRAGLVSSLGIHVGTLVHIAAAVAGLSAILVASANAFTIGRNERVAKAGASSVQVYTIVDESLMSWMCLSFRADAVVQTLENMPKCRFKAIEQNL